MSILLESLNQSKEDNKGDVPSVTDSHFDDEMLSDEWLLKKLKMWRIFSAYLLVFVIVSVSFFYYYITTSENKISELSLQLEQAMINNKNLISNNSKAILTKENDNSQQSELVQPIEETNGKESSRADNRFTEIKKTAITTTESSSSPTIKTQYQPQKQKANDSINSTNINDISNSKSSTDRQSKFSDSGQSISPDKPTEFESLSEIEKSELPDLEISSYAVSSNPQKSFVVLNGAFYGQGEVIAPNLELISINKEGIVIRYKGRFIRKKYSL